MIHRWFNGCICDRVRSYSVWIHIARSHGNELTGASVTRGRARIHEGTSTRNSHRIWSLQGYYWRSNVNYGYCARDIRPQLIGQRRISNRVISHCIYINYSQGDEWETTVAMFSNSYSAIA